MAGPSPDPALDGESRVGEIIAILSVASILSTLAVTLRCYSRAVILRSFGLDDAIIVPAQILTLASAVAIGLESKYGLGRHIWMMPDEDFIPYMKSFYSSIAVYNVAVCLTKISILLQYKRIFSNTILKKIIVVGLCFLTCWAVTLSFLLPMVCMPVAAFWDPNVKGFCLDNATIWYVMAGVNVVTDFAVFTMPIPVISSLQLPRKQKAMLLIVFTLGIFPCAVSIYRIKTLSAAAKSTDPTWDNVDAATFSFLELSVGVIAVCLPTIRPVLVQTMPRIFGSLLRSAGHSVGTGGPKSGPRASRTPFGGAGSAAGGTGAGSSAARASMFKGSTLRDTDSTEELRLGDEEAALPRSALGNDIEFGELDKGILTQNPGGKRYSVSVVAGWEPSSFNEVSVSGGEGIKTTTVVTQKVSFAGMLEEEEEGARRLADKGML
ncbi:hypothetical protein CHGG_07532 [Chaetomium globosum CBS 148.51]|uniref:Rhodopsin domain-containing protein n=1 Tax=Chaetomium globosum (strain ATCC 6205 / CBS 148.51 / DSM 1962 / NBRC 6347 / NRRL 1970) TaxID=306901 RepID=Q2GWX2_CHAGB|nr:uncharacterized protein CHGG_07532 [Chaetomium globosum CBS 148.51]EAQ86279.1 hypothetical protein CHGG_07532 [Chaetomium globosum CBS 148.51]